MVAKEYKREEMRMPWRFRLRRLARWIWLAPLIALIPLLLWLSWVAPMIAYELGRRLQLNRGSSPRPA